MEDPGPLPFCSQRGQAGRWYHCRCSCRHCRLRNRFACLYVFALGRAKHRRLHQRTRCGDFVKPSKGIVYENNIVDGGDWLPPPRLRLDSDGDTCGCARHAGAARCLRAGRLSALQPVHPRRKAYRKLPAPQPRESQPGLPQGVQQWPRAPLSSAAVRLTRAFPLGLPAAVRAVDADHQHI
jgi:hypothetical protein